MRIEDSFRVALPVEDAWRLLLDLERIAPCLPGAQLQEVEGDEYRGVVKVKVGPITAQYKGAAHLADADDAAHRAVLEASGRETRGQGNASATITMALAEEAGGTRVHLETDLSITGKVAQFGRGILADVSSKLLAQFAANLEREVSEAGAPAPAPAAATEAREIDVAAIEAEEARAAVVTGTRPASAAGNGAGGNGVGGVRRIEAPEPEAVDLFGVGARPRCAGSRRSSRGRSSCCGSCAGAPGPARRAR